MPHAGESSTLATVCSFCGTGCELAVTVEEGRIVSVKGSQSGPVNRGESCIKGLQAWKYVHSEQRLTYPLIRRNGKLVRATWQEAIDEIGAAIEHTRERYGPDALGCLSSSRATNEVNYAAQKFMRQVIGTNNIDSCNRT
jgi:predicted molibdopterin-dependent oxidoreductase YjgC